jgi:LuxR family transcriptional regulator, maltose regulon positive regulatory protein
MNAKEPILPTTKFKIPKPIAEGIHRPRLEVMLAQAFETSSVISVTAPAGSGKTTIVTQALQTLEYPIAWIQLDISDDNPIQFWTVFATALQRIHPDILLHTSFTSTLPDNYQSLREIVTALAKLETRFVVILDDFHHIASDAVHRQLEWLLNQELPAMCLVLISRTENPLNLARLHVQRKAVTLDADALRFTSDETAAFLRETMSLNASSVLVEHLWKITSGWPVALQLLALKLRNNSDLGTSPNQWIFLDRQLTRYFDEEIFNTLSLNIQTFLLRTSLLQDLRPDLCRLITDSDGGNILEQLANDQLFVHRLQGGDQQYRYHSLFAEYLRNRLQRDYPEWVPILHQQIAEYYRQIGIMDIAVSHAIASGIWDYAEDLVAETVWDLINRGLQDTVLGWLERFPPEYLAASPPLTVFYGWVLFLQGKFDRAKQQLTLAEKNLSKVGDSLVKSSHDELKGEIYTIRASLAHLSGNLEKAIEYAQEALNLLPESQHMIRGYALGTLGYTQWMNGDADSAQASINYDPLNENPLQDELTTLLIKCNQASMLALLGNLYESGQAFENILSIALNDPQRYQVIAAVAHFGIGLLLYAWNDLEQAREHIRKGLELGQPWIYMSMLLPAYITLANVEQALHYEQAADHALDQMERHITAGHLTPMLELLQINRMRLNLIRGNLPPVRKWALRVKDQLGELEANPISIWRQFTYAEFLISQGSLESSLEILNPLQAFCGLLSLEWMRLDIQLLRCIAFWKSGNSQKALEIMREVLMLSEPQGHIRLFLYRGEVIQEILQQLQNPDASATYISELLQAFKQEAKRATWMLLDTAPGEILSDREKEILFFIGQGATNRKIAERLVISEGTVKAHIKHILQKLNAENRMDAIAKARDRMLID